MDLLWSFLVGLALLMFLTFVFVRYMSVNPNFFKELGIVTPPVTPLLGNFGQMLKLGMFEMQTHFYEQFKDLKVYGWYEGRKPLIIIRDVDIVRDVFIKHFNAFSNRRLLFELEPPLTSALSALRGEHWKRVRNAVSPAFSSGRIRRMSPHVERAGKQLVEYLREKEERNEEIELKNVCSSLTLATIASTAFGLDVNTMKDPNNVFAITAKKSITPSMSVLLISMLFPELSPIMYRLGLSFFNTKAIDYLINIVDSAMQNRKEQGEVGKVNDFLDLVMDAEASGEIEKGQLSKSEIQAQAVLFIMAGYETVSQALSFTLFLLANHPEHYQKAEDEISLKLGNESPNYDNVQGLTYVDACINESMRMFPSGVFIDRMCTEDTDINGVHFPKGVAAFIPLYAIHHDPELWPQPEQFRPERFSPENKDNIRPGSFFPFGQGPRMCVGMRLALLELRVAIVSILQNFRLVPCNKTVYPIRLNKWLPQAEDGLWVKLQARKKVA